MKDEDGPRVAARTRRTYGSGGGCDCLAVIEMIGSTQRENANFFPRSIYQAFFIEATQRSRAKQDTNRI